MDDLIFEAEPLLGTGKGSCGCASCRGELETEWDGETDDEYGDDEWEWDVVAPKADKRPRDSSCTTPMPDEVLGCRRHGSQAAKMCLPSANMQCPAIPELWKSLTVAGVPFWYGVKTAKVPGTKKVAVTHVEQKRRETEMTPAAWQSLHKWVGLMGAFGMPLAAIISAGARYCRCIKKPYGVCKHDVSTHPRCTGTTLSNHSFGDAIDITGVVWKDPAMVGSSLKVTLMHSWADSGDQGRLLRRINAALRLCFSTVIDYSDPGHRDHFHVDTNRGKPRTVFGMGADKYFILGALKNLGYIDAVKKPLSWTQAQQGLAAFARRSQMQPPTNANDREAWRPVVHRLYSCVAIGDPASCRNQP